MSNEGLKQGTVISCVVLAAILVSATLSFMIAAFLVPPERFEILKQVFQEAVENVFLPMFTALITATLAYIFGKELVSAISARIRGNAPPPAR